MNDRIRKSWDIGKGTLPTGMPIEVFEAKSELALPEALRGKVFNIANSKKSFYCC